MLINNITHFLSMLVKYYSNQQITLGTVFLIINNLAVSM